MVACLCGNNTEGGQTPTAIGLTTFTGLVGLAATDGKNKTGDAAKFSGTVLYEDKGRLSVREADREPNSKKNHSVKCAINWPPSKT